MITSAKKVYKKNQTKTKEMDKTLGQMVKAKL